MGVKSVVLIAPLLLLLLPLLLLLLFLPHVIISRKEGLKCLKPIFLSGESLEKVVSHRPLSMFITVGVNTSNDRSQGRRITL